MAGMAMVSTVAMAVAGPSKRFCTSCCRALWACQSGHGRPQVPTRHHVHSPSTENWRPFRRWFSVAAKLNAPKATKVTVEGKDKITMEDFPPERIRNFSIIAHIDHGKSTLADRLLQMTNTVPSNASPQFLDKLKVERERGITVKAQTVSIIHTHTDGQRYLINLIDTPGHVDFSYEVSRSLGACEGGLLLVDSTQGIQAQTLSVFYVALEADLTILGVINKIDLPHAEADKVSETIDSNLGIEKAGHMRISAKSGIGVEEVLKQIVEKLPPPEKWPNDDGKLRALVFDTHYDHFRGVVSLIRVMSGSVKIGDKIRFLQADRKYEVLEIGINNPDETPVTVLKEGQVGYLICSMKNSEEAHIGDTICHESQLVDPLPGFKPTKSMVFAGVFPTDSADFDKLKEAIERLTLNDRSVSVAKESSAALMQGFRLGFLGTLHMDVFKQRLEDEYSSEVIITAPTVPYRLTKGKEVRTISNPCEFPDHTTGYLVEEPMIHSTIIVPIDYIGPLMDLCSKYRSRQLEYKILETERAILRYAFPLSEIVTDFFSALKSVSSGFASFDYEEAGYEESDLVRLNVLLNGNAVDALSMIVHRSAAQTTGKEWCKRMKEVVPRQQFELAIQAAIGNKVIARETVPAMRKDVTAGLYGGHFERKKKHLEKQKAGKKRLKRLAGNIDIPQSAFFSVLSRSYSTTSTASTTTSAASRFNLPPPLPIIQFPDDLPHFQLPRVSNRPLQPPSVPPVQRSRQLSDLYAMLDPLVRPDPVDLYKRFSRIHGMSQSHILTPDEITLILRKLYTAIQREGTSIDVARFMIDNTNNALQDLTGPTDLTRFFKILMLVDSPRRPTVRSLRDVKDSLDRMEDQNSQMYKMAVNFYLGLCANARAEEEFEQYWEDATRLGLDSFAWIARFSLLDRTHKVDQLAQTLSDALKQVETTEFPNQSRLLNHALGIYARHGRWNVASKMYHHMTDCPPLQFDSDRRENEHWLDKHVIEAMKQVKTRRFTFSTMVSALCHSGHLAQALQVLQDMERANHPPFTIEYSALFDGFARYGEIQPISLTASASPLVSSASSTATSVARLGRASGLFSPWRIYEVGHPKAHSYRPLPPSTGPEGQEVEDMERHRYSRQWDGQAYRSDWTRSALESTFEALMSLRPGMRRAGAMNSSPHRRHSGGRHINPSDQSTGQEGDRTSGMGIRLGMGSGSAREWDERGSRVDSHRAPTADTAFKILLAFARVTSCDLRVLSRVWRRMDGKYTKGEWDHWKESSQVEVEDLEGLLAMSVQRQDPPAPAGTEGQDPILHDSWQEVKTEFSVDSARAPQARHARQEDYQGTGQADPTIKGMWKHWDKNARLLRLVQGLEELEAESSWTATAASAAAARGTQRFRANLPFMEALSTGDETLDLEDWDVDEGRDHSDHSVGVGGMGPWFEEEEDGLRRMGKDFFTQSRQ